MYKLHYPVFLYNCTNYHHKNMNDKENDKNRRQFIKPIGTETLSAMALTSLETLNVFAINTTPSASLTMQV